MEINIYQNDGSITGMLYLPGGIEYISGRTSKVGNKFFKGVGCFYKGHASLHPEAHDIIVDKASVFYYGYDVERAIWRDKFGIFLDRYQPYFSDMIGACGPKEEKIIKHSKEFEFSEVSVEEVVPIINDQSYYVLSYKSGEKKSYLEEGTPKKLVDLLIYMINNNWNFTWDKTSIKDVSSSGKVSDVADMFMSSDIIHKVGTIYSVLFSLHQLSLDKFKEFLDYLQTPYCGLAVVPELIISILKGCNIDVSEFTIDSVKDKQDLYINFIGNYVIRGRNCSSVEDISYNEEVARSYLDRFITQIPEDKKYLINWS